MKKTVRLKGNPCKMNCSISNSTTFLSSCSKTRTTALIIVQSCVGVFLALAAFVGNLIVCLVVYRRHSFRNVTNTFVVSLAVSDPLTSLLLVPSVVSSVANRWVFGQIGCLIQAICTLTLAGISLITMALIAVNRYVRIVQPKRYPSIYTKRSSKLMVITIWILAPIVISLTNILSGVQYRITSYTTIVCLPYNKHGSNALILNLTMVILIVSTNVLIVFCYARVFRKIRRHNTEVAPSLQQNRGTSCGVEERRMINLFMVILVGFYMCWLPPCLYSIFILWKRSLADYLQFVLMFPFGISIVINPLIYAVMSKPFRTEYIKLIRCM